MKSNATHTRRNSVHLRPEQHRHEQNPAGGAGGDQLDGAYLRHDHNPPAYLGLRNPRRPHAGVPDLVAFESMRRRLCPELRQGRRLVDDLASVVGCLPQGIRLRGCRKKRPRWAVVPLFCRFFRRYYRPARGPIRPGTIAIA